MIINQDRHMADTREDEHQSSPHRVKALLYFILSFIMPRSIWTRKSSFVFNFIVYIQCLKILFIIRYGFHVNNPDEVARGEKPNLTEVRSTLFFLKNQTSQRWDLWNLNSFMFLKTQTSPIFTHSYFWKTKPQKGEVTPIISPTFPFSSK